MKCEFLTKDYTSQALCSGPSHISIMNTLWLVSLRVLYKLQFAKLKSPCQKGVKNADFLDVVQVVQHHFFSLFNALTLSKLEF